MRLIIGNIFGLISALLFWGSYFKDNKKKILSVHIGCNVSDIIQYLILEQYTGLADSLNSLLSNIIFIKFKNKPVIILLASIKVISLLAVPINVFNVLFIIKTISYTIALLYGNEQQMRIVSVAGSIIWMIYDFSAGAYIAFICGIGSVIFVSISYIKYLKK